MKSLNSYLFFLNKNNSHFEYKTIFVQNTYTYNAATQHLCQWSIEKCHKFYILKIFKQYRT